MERKEVDELVNREPFIPFRVYLSNGESIEIHRPRNIAVTRTQIFIVLPDDRWKFIPLEHIASIETLQPA